MHFCRLFYAHRFSVLYAAYKLPLERHQKRAISKRAGCVVGFTMKARKKNTREQNKKKRRLQSSSCGSLNNSETTSKTIS